MLNLRIIISPSKEMTDQPQTARRNPILIQSVKELSTNKELTADTEHYQAINLYNGLQFRYLKDGLTDEDIRFLDESLRILSARYGIVRPLDGIRHYRKDFTTKGLYKLWGDKIYQALSDESQLILNLASDEYSKTITRYASDEDRIITVDFLEQTPEGDLKKHASISKKGRGQLVNYIARNRITNSQDVKKFDDLDYQFSEEQSDSSNWVFIRPKN